MHSTDVVAIVVGIFAVIVSVAAVYYTLIISTQTNSEQSHEQMRRPWFPLRASEDQEGSSNPNLFDSQGQLRYIAEASSSSIDDGKKKELGKTKPDPPPVKPSKFGGM